MDIRLQELLQPRPSAYLSYRWTAPGLLNGPLGQISWMHAIWNCSQSFWISSPQRCLMIRSSCSHFSIACVTSLIRLALDEVASAASASFTWDSLVRIGDSIVARHLARRLGHCFGQSRILPSRLPSEKLDLNAAVDSCRSCQRIAVFMPRSRHPSSISACRSALLPNLRSSSRP